MFQKTRYVISSKNVPGTNMYLREYSCWSYKMKSNMWWGWQSLQTSPPADCLISPVSRINQLPQIACLKLKSLGKWPTWRTIIFYVFIFIFNSLHVSSTSCSSSGEINCVNTTSGNCHSVYCRWPCRVQVGSEMNLNIILIKVIL